MKFKWKKQTIALLLVAMMVLSVIPFTELKASADNLRGKISEKIGKSAPINKEYIDYLEDNENTQNTENTEKTEEDKDGITEKKVNGVVPSTLDLSYLSENYAKQLKKSKKAKSITSLPTSYDMRDDGSSPSVVDQGNYGTCWAFESRGILESMLIKQNSLISLSQNHLAWFTYKGAEEEESYSYYIEKNGGNDPYNNGGNFTRATACLSAWKGPIYSSEFSSDIYNVDESLRNRSAYHIQDANVFGGSLFSSNLVLQADINLVKQIMIENQTAFGIDYYDDFVHFNAQTGAQFYKQNHYANHAVLIIGWDDNYSKENFNEDERPEHDGAWLVRGSWGLDYGNNGTIWISYEDATIEYSGSYTIEENDNYAKNYQYDTLGWGISVSADDFVDEKYALKSGYMSNIFTSESDEQLEAVSFYTTDANTSYEISVYTGVDEGKPTSGTKVLDNQSGSEFYCGYHTIELDKPIKLKAGERFSIVVKLTNPEYEYPIPVEFTIYSYGKDKFEYLGNGGESFISTDGSNWSDIIDMNSYDEYSGNYYSNVCLKAFTNPISEDNADVSHVQFSLPEGSAAIGEKVELIGNGELYYQITDAGGNVGAETKYTEPITINGNCTIAAWAQDGDKKGIVNKNTYTVAKSQLIEIITEQNGKKNLIDLHDGKTEITLDDAEYGKPIKILPHGSGNITVNGNAVKSDEWSEGITLTPDVENTITIVSSEEGKISTTYNIKIVGKSLDFDYENKTVSYDDTHVSVKDSDGNVVANGASISKYITLDGESAVYLSVTNLTTGKVTKEKVAQIIKPGTQAKLYTGNEIVYSKYNNCVYADNPEMNNAKLFNYWRLKVKPGQTLYIKCLGDSDYIATDVYELVVPNRPEAPKAEVEKVNKNTVRLKTVDNAEYRLSGKEWQDRNVFEDLNYGEEYTFQVRLKNTSTLFASNVATVKVKIQDAYYVEVVYRDVSNNSAFCTEYIPALLGKNTVKPNQELIDMNILKLADNSQSEAIVNITEKDGELVADKETVYFDIMPSIVTSFYSYTAKYFDRSGNEIGQQVIPYSNIGNVLRGNVPTPKGYQVVIDDDNDYYDWMTSLVYINRKWICFYDKFNILVEKMPEVKVNFVTEDGEILSDLSYVEYLGETGEISILPTIPDGYIAADNLKYSATVTRDENNELQADI
ncbi:MAG: lectin like domain-containing protein, partial [Acutalibacteraceae bacterium]